MDALAAIKPEGEARKLFEQRTFDESDDGWGPLKDSPELQEVLKNKLRAIGEQDLANNLDFTAMAKQSSGHVIKSEVLVHNDVRADNCAWNAKTNDVRLVDWNWTQLGDIRVDTAAVLVHAKKAGYDISDYEHRLDGATLHWIAGFWLRAAATPIWPDGPESLRPFQLKSGITALRLANKLLG